MFSNVYMNVFGSVCISMLKCVYACLCVYKCALEWEPLNVYMHLSVLIRVCVQV